MVLVITLTTSMTRWSQVSRFIWNLHKRVYIIFVSCTSLIWLLNWAPYVGSCIIFCLTSKLCAESCTRALTIPYPELSEIGQNLNSKSSFCLLGAFFRAGSYIIKKFREMVKNTTNYLTSIWGTERTAEMEMVMPDGQTNCSSIDKVYMAKHSPQVRHYLDG